MKLLLVEDDAPTARYLRQGLEELGHVCDTADNGVEGLTAALVYDYEAIVLDRNLPTLDGLSMLRAFRAEGRSTPVLVLSALGHVDDRVAGLKAGADDYLTKPFSFQELILRIESISRRRAAKEEGPALLSVGNLKLDLRSRAARRGDRHIELSNKEFQLLEYMMRHAGQVATRTMMLEAIWNYSTNPGANIIDVHVSKLRTKIDAPGECSMIQTVRGAGYRLDAH